MKKSVLTIVAVLIIVILSGKRASAQMEGAQQIKWDVAKDVQVAVSQDAVWLLLSDMSAVPRYSNGYIKSAEMKSEGSDVIRVATFADGTQRSDLVAQMDKENKFFVLTTEKESLPAGINAVQIAVFTKANGDKSVVNFKANISGTNEAKKELMAKLQAEFDNYATGLTNLYKHSIPAIQMN